MRQWWIWLLGPALVVVVAYQGVQVHSFRRAEQQAKARTASLFRYALRRAEFQSLAASLERLAAAGGIEETVERFKEAKTLAVAFTDDLLMLNDLRYGGQPVGPGLQYGDYLYNPSTREQEALMWQIARTRLYALLWTMERKYYVDEGVMQESDRLTLEALRQQVDAVTAIMDEVRARVDAPAGEVEAAARQMEQLAEPLAGLERLISQYEAGLPSLEPKPGSRRKE